MSCKQQPAHGCLLPAARALRFAHLRRDEHKDGAVERSLDAVDRGIHLFRDTARPASARCRRGTDWQQAALLT
jgi:hypothetical protein